MTKKRSLRLLFTKQRLLLIMALLAWMPASHAWMTTYHAGFLLGDSSQSVSNSDIERSLNNENWSTDNLSFTEDSKIKKLYGGFYFTPNFGVQLEYIDLGKVNIKGTGLASNEEQEFADALAGAIPSFGEGVALSVIGRFPIWGNFVIQDWVGLFGWKNEVEVDLPNGQYTGDDNGLNFAVGVSLEYLLSDVVSARIEWERFNQDGDGINILGAGMTFYFGS
jgi:hypothetical protein